MATRRGCQDRSPRERKSPAGLGESPPVLTLSHFCPKPFLCFGNVRLGASKTLPLALLNPNPEAAAVTLPRCPAAAQGFEVWPSALELQVQQGNENMQRGMANGRISSVLGQIRTGFGNYLEDKQYTFVVLDQPKEKNVISVNWTPIKGGRVREILTFHVNGIVKHEVILLGNAEEPKKKKRSLWDTINKKKVSAPSSRKKRISNIQNVNETFSVSQKVDRVRSPLQARENLGRKEGCSPTENSSLILEGDKIPISPISPTFKGCRGEPGLPLCVRRSTTYTCLHASENGELWKLEDANISKGFNEKVLTETSVDSIHNNSQVEEESKLTVTPNCPSTLNVSQSHGSFLSPDSFVKNSHAADHELKSVPCMSSDTFLKDDSRPVHLESKPVHEAYRTILSPDSFLKDNYGLSAEVESESVSPILSSSRCVEDNVTRRSLSQQTCKLSPFLNGYSQASESPPVQRKNEVLLCIPECQSSDFPGTIFEGPKSSEMKPNCDSFTKHNQPGFSAVQDISGYSHKTQLKRRPVLSATVTKLKPTGNRENKTETSQPKARRCLCSVEGENEKVADSAEERDTLRSYLPVIEPAVSSPTSCKTAVDFSSRAASAARKRKSEGNVEGARVLVGVAEHTEAPATEKIRFSPWASTTSAAKKTRKVIMPVSNPASSREKLHPKKRLDSLAHKTPSSKTNGRTKRVVPVAQSHLTFIKPLKTDVPRHPMPFAARNMFYDERWKEKQQQGFTWWLNFVLTPDDLTVKTSVSEVNAAALLLGVENQHKLSVPRAPTKDEMSLRAYTARCRLNRLRRAACRLFTSEKMVQAIKKLEIEIEARRLVVRKDRHLWKDVGERQKVLRWLLSYNPLWLRIGLETVFGELVALEDNSDVMGMAVFIVSRLLWNPDLAAEYRHPSVPHLYRDGHEEALSRFTLKKLLLLVCFLDHAKVSRLIDHDPCLFCKDAEFKTSKDLLLAFSRDFLSGEGDLSRHLSLLGLPVSHVQTPFDEFDFAVTNLAVDLQCGVRLVRAVELLTQNWNLSKSLRVPAISRLQKIHNVDLALQALRVRGVRLQDEHGNAILPKDIVDRHREKTLALLWSIALALQVDVSLDLDQLKEEIDFLRHTWSLRKTVPAPSSRRDAARGAQAGPGPRGSPAQQSESVRLLMAWVNALCAFYGTRVENFTVSFSDGRVLCYLIHHYHPGCVPFHAICQRTTQTVECAQTGSVVLNSSSESEESCLDVSLKAPDPENADVHRELLENERRNFQLVGSAVRDLGGVPAMLHHADMSNTIPDEKVVITFLSFLCARLLDLRRETRAARLIQTAWRRHKVKSDLRRRQERDKAARIIQSAITHFLARRRLKKEVSAARVIQKSWRRFLRQRELLMLRKAELEKIQSKSALVIQKYWRRYSTRKKFLTLKKYSIILQSRIRAKMAVASYKRCVQAAVTIQSQWRACVRRRQDQQRYKTLRSSCLIIQSAFRRWQRRQMRRRIKAAITLQGAFRQWRARKRAKEEKSATVIQSWYRMHRELRRYSHTRSCVLTIQTEFRRFRAQKLYKRKREAIRTIQTRWRAHLEARGARARYLQKLAAAVCIQAAFRAVRARRLRRQNAAACVLQAYWRMRQERLRFLALRNTVVTLQAHVRKHQQLQKYKKMQKAALVIQTRFRAHIAARTVLASYQRTRSAAIVLQAACRARRARKAVHHALTCVIRIQACYRAHVCRKHFLSLKHTTVKLQSMVRRQQARKRYLQLRAAVVFVQQRYRFLQRATRRRGEVRQVLEACVRLQAWARGHQVRRQVRLQRAAATSLQAHFRMRTVRRGYLRMRQAALVIQRCYRAHRVWLQQQEALRARRAATCLQAAFRGHCVRRLLRRRALAALTIQSAFRGHRERANYRRVLQSAVQIQRWYRANCAARGLRTRFLKVRAAVLTLQAAYRGWRVREQISRDRLAAVALQAAFRRARDQRRFQQLKAAALALQRRRRAQAVGRAQRRDYLRLRRAVLTLQAACRGRAARRRIQRQHACATLIQSCYRMHAQRRRWVAVRKAARLIQTWFRACCQGRRQRLAYLKTKAAVLVLQSAHRRMRERKKRAEERTKAAATIQARYRAYRAKKRRAACRAAAVTIQRWYRSVKIADRQHKEYLHLKKSATRIQAVYRGVQVRRHIGRMHMAATFIKATFQMHLLKRRFRKMRAAAVIIQVRYRAYCRGKTQRAQYLAVLKAVHILQAGFRGARVRWNLRRMQAAAVVIQSGYRRHREQARFRRVKAATKTVQRRYRAMKAGNEQSERYRQLRRAAILLQAAFRGMRARRRVKAMHSAAVLIQRRVRALRTRRRFLSLRKTAVWVQRKYRAKVHNKHHLAFLRLQEAAITIQSSFRGWAVRKRLQEMRGAATVIQATFRMHRAQVSYQALRHAAVLMQRRYRGCRAAELQRERFVRQRHSAVVIQAAYRGWRARQLLQGTHRAAVLIQSTYRMHRQYVFYRKVQWATKLIQEKYRANKRRALELRALAEAGARVQAGPLDLAMVEQAQEQHLAATTVQKHFRGFRVRKRYLRLRAAVVFVQRRYRAIAAAHTLAALHLQASQGGAREQRGTRGGHPATPRIQPSCSTHGAHAARPVRRGTAAALQSRCRPRVGVKTRRKQSSAVQTPTPAAQAAFRDTETGLELENATEEEVAATADRPASRWALAETRQEAAWSSVVGPPTCSEALVACSPAAAGHSQSRAAVTVPNAFHTMAAGTLDLELWAALRVQSFLGTAACRRRFVQQRRAAITLQLSFRARRARRQLWLWRRAAVVLQTRLRACLSAKRQRRAYLWARSSAIIIQAKTRGLLQKRRFLKIRESALKMQRSDGKASVRLLRFAAAAYHHLCAVRIQRAYRRHLAVQDARSHLHAVVCTQRQCPTRSQLKRRMQMPQSILNVDREVEEHQRRRHRAASVIQRAVRCFLRRREQERFRNGIVKVQALWKGYSWRKKNGCAQIEAVRRRLQMVSAEVREENTLSRRAALALHHLLTYRHLSAVLEALKHLEVVTRLSPLCCESVAQSGGVSKVLVLIRSCNRSVPCMDVICYAVQVLLNLAKYEKTMPAVRGDEACVDTLLQLLQRYREKPGDKVADKSRSIFSKTCCLLAVVLKATGRASDVRNRRDVVDCVYSVYKLTARKRTVNTESMPCKENKNGSLSTPFTPDTAVRTRAVPRLQPDWVLSRDNMQEIGDPLHAIQMVMDTLGIPF